MKKKFRDIDAVIGKDFRKFLADTYEEKKKKRPRLSFRAFASLAGEDPTTLRKLISGQRPLGPTVIEKLGRKLGLSADQIKVYIEIQKTRKNLGTTSADAIKPKYRKLDAKSLEVMSSWKAYAFLELLGLPSFRQDPVWIAKVMEVTTDEVNDLVKSLIEIDWLRMSAQDKWSPVANGSTTDPNDPQMVKFKIQLLRSIFAKGEQTLLQVPKDRRTFQGQTFAIDENLLPEAAEKIRSFRNEMKHFLQKDGNQNQVYEMIVALYPLTHIEDKET